MLHPIEVSHARGSYPVYVADGSLARLEDLVRGLLPGRRLVLITDETVNQLYRAGKLGGVAWTGETLLFPSGENSKTRETWARLSDALLQNEYGRDSALIGLGGGVVGDLVGFVAATYLRGVPYVLAPTTLLAMVDASVGGKTGVNTPLGKNLIGAFHQPSAVVADPHALAPLPDAAYRDGLAEAVKHGLIADKAYFQWIEEDRAQILRRDRDAVQRLVRRSVEIKAQVVSADEREAGPRAILNAGHTVAHALEAVSDFRLPHGAAVALGLAVECQVAEQLQIAEPGLRKRVQALLEQLGFSIRLPFPLDSEAVLERMSSDKKNRGGKVHCSLVQSIGKVAQRDGWTVAVPRQELAVALKVII